MLTRAKTCLPGNVAYIAMAAAIITIGGMFALASGARPTRAHLTLTAPPPRGGDLVDDDEPLVRLALGRQSYQDNCLICHGDELVSGQRLTAKQWTAEIDKMIGWGAPVPADQTAMLLEYLSNRYSEKTPAQPPDRLSFARAEALVRPEPVPPAARAGDPARGRDLYAANCAKCHGAAARGADLGTNLIGRPVVHRALEFTEIVRKGLRRMPGFAQVLTPAQEGDIRAWLLQQPVTIDATP
jgi:mono/diheme cytochrome c family protein